MNFNERVIFNELRFNDTDDQIVDYIKLDINRFINQSIQKSAKELFTVPNTIVRFSKKLGYKGISDLKFGLRQEMQNIENNKKNTKPISENIDKTIEIIDFNLIEKLVKKIKESKKITLLGIGDSTYFCEMFVKNLRCVGKQAEFFEHRHDVMYSINACDFKDLYIAISVSGESKSIIEEVEKIKEKGAYVVSLTHFKENTLSKLSDLNLFFWAPYECINGYNTTDRVGIMILLRSISEKYWEKYQQHM